ncbi:hypothetical protein C0J52_07713 [Blattella germanica]|nr:hypothetical protein C0J52_07713 [Blattella germanica]
MIRWWMHDKMNDDKKVRDSTEVHDDIVDESEMQQLDDSGIPGSYKFISSEFCEYPRRRIDFVLAYFNSDDDKKEKRLIFQSNLENAGLELESEKSVSRSERLTFIKIHIPADTLLRNANILDIKYAKRHEEEKTWKLWVCMVACIKCKFHIFRKSSQAVSSSHFGTETNGTREAVRSVQDNVSFSNISLQNILSENVDPEVTLSETDRIRVVWNMLKRTKYGPKQRNFGIMRLLKLGVYSAAYPLHSGTHKEDPPSGKRSLRRTLFVDWACFKSAFLKEQPLDLVRDYFGEEVGLYFAWMEYYIDMLLYAAIAGLIVFFYGAFSWNTNDTIPSEEICNSDFIICPRCLDESICKSTHLKYSCVYAKLTYYFDNPSTMFFAVFMTFWATVFVRVWKRREAVILWRWNMFTVEYEDETRPQFEMKAKHVRQNSVTGNEELYVPLPQKISGYVISMSVVVMMTTATTAISYSLILFRMEIVETIRRSPNLVFRKYHEIVATLTSAGLSVTTILIYTAFFKGMFYHHPGYIAKKHSLSQDICDPAGCLSEVFMQLVVTLSGKQMFHTVYQVFKPKIVIMISKFRHRGFREIHFPSWEKDYDLIEFKSKTLFYEQLEMVIQYGFVTLFVASFPLAPLLAFINNFVEVRVDAYNLLVNTRRSVPRKVRGLGAWNGILRGLTYLAVVFNAFLIAYTSDFMPRTVYKFQHGGSLVGFVNSSLSIFAYKDFPNSQTHSNATCRYGGHRLPPDSPYKYWLSGDYLKIISWEIDYQLLECKERDLFTERLEMVLQYGFVTMFGTSFPLAPVFAIVYNIFLIRLHAYNLLVLSRRIVPRKVRGLGIWETMLQCFTYLSVVSSAFLIAFTSDFIPRLVYKIKNNWDLTGYILTYYLATFDTDDYGVGPLPFKTCRYIGFRLPPSDPNKYKHSMDFWYVVIVRVAFIMVFEHAVFILVAITSYAIPDVPNSVKQRMALDREQSLKAREAMYSKKKDD